MDAEVINVTRKMASCEDVFEFRCPSLGMRRGPSYHFSRSSYRTLRIVYDSPAREYRRLPQQNHPTLPVRLCATIAPDQRSHCGTSGAREPAFAVIGV